MKKFMIAIVMVICAASVSLAEAEKAPAAVPAAPQAASVAPVDQASPVKKTAPATVKKSGKGLKARNRKATDVKKS